MKEFLSSRFSTIEEQTWPQQEAALASSYGSETDCKDETARGILKDENARARAVYLVEKLAEADGTDKESFALRIIDNAETPYLAGMKILLEQRALEAHLNAVVYNEAMTEQQKGAAIAEMQAIAVVYSVKG